MYEKIANEKFVSQESRKSRTFKIKFVFFFWVLDSMYTYITCIIQGV